MIYCAVKALRGLRNSESNFDLILSRLRRRRISILQCIGGYEIVNNPSSHSRISSYLSGRSKFEIRIRTNGYLLMEFLRIPTRN